MDSDAESRFRAALTKRLHLTRRRLTSAVMRPNESADQCERRCQRGATPWAGLEIARHIFALAEAAGDREVTAASVELYDAASIRLRKDRADQRRADEEADERERAWDREQEQKRQQEEKERWAALEFCSTTEFDERIGRHRDVRGYLQASGYLEGDYGSWRLTEKAIEEGVGRLDVRGPKQKVILWKTSFVDSVQRELEEDEGDEVDE